MNVKMAIKVTKGQICNGTISKNECHLKYKLRAKFDDFLMECKFDDFLTECTKSSYLCAKSLYYPWRN